VIATVIVTLCGSMLAQGRSRSFLARLFRDSEKTVRVHEVRVDRHRRSFIDTVFTRPVAGKRLGEIVTDAPVSIYPAMHGVWRWYGVNVLRFEPSGQLPLASEYKLVVNPQQLVSAEQEFAGEKEFVVRTDDFLVRRVTWSEVPGEDSTVSFQGEIEFNYAVSPAVLAPRIHLRDGTAEGHIDILTGYPTQTLTFKTAPIRKEKAARSVSIVINSDVSSTEGNVTLGHDFEQALPIGSRDILVVRGVKATPAERETTIRIELSSPVSAASAQQKLTITPAVHSRVESEGNDLLVIGKFTPGQSYELRLGEGLVATDSALLASPFQQTVPVADLEPLLNFQSDGMFLSSSGYRTLAVDSINVPKAQLTVDRVYRNNLFFYLESSGYSRYGDDEEGDNDSYYRPYMNSQEVGHVYGDRLIDKEIVLGGNANHRQTTTISMEPLITGQKPGLYKVSLRRNDDDWRGTSRWVLITDIGIVVKHSKSEMLVWTASFRDLAPVAGTTITLVSDQNQTLARGTTDARGFATLKSIKTDAHPFLLIAQHGADFSFLLLGNSRVDTSPFDVGGDTIGDAGYSAFLYGERGLYRPGEKVQGLVVLRDRLLAAPPRMPIVLRHKDPEGADRGSIRVDSDASGSASFEIALPPYAKTGRHTLEALIGKEVVGSWGFQVEEFVPDRIKVAIQPAVSTPKSLSFSVSSDYLFGAPAASLAVETKVRLVPSTFEPKGFEAFRFGNFSRKFDPREISSDQSRLDDKGRREYSIDVPANLSVPSSLEAVITARVQEQGGRGVSALSRMPVHPYPLYVGLRRLPESDSGGSMAFEYLAVSPTGKEVATPPLRADFFEDRWHTVLRLTANGGYNYESTRDSEQVRTISLPAGKGHGHVAFNPREWGSYRVVITDPATLASSELEFDSWNPGRGYSPWAMRNPGRLELTLDKADYAPGEQATVQIKAPFSGKALVTVERDRVYSSQVVELTGNTARVTVPIPAEGRPNAFITATVVRTAADLEPGEAGRAFGAIKVDIDRARNQLKPEIRAVDAMRSNRKLQIEVVTTPGATVTVSAVDEGILQLIAQKAPDPFGYFYRQLALDVATHDIFALLLPEVKPKSGALAGGSESGEGVAQFLSTESIRRTRPVAFWSGSLVADSAGSVRVSFAIPELQGAVRITAVAHDHARFGSSEKMVRVHDPLVLLPTVPRFLSTDDVAQIPVTVRNDSPASGTFTVTVTASGAVSVQNPSTQQIEIAKGREATALFPIVGGPAHGEARLAFAVAGNWERATASAVFPVQSPLPAVTEEAAGSLTSSAVDLPSTTTTQFRADSVQRELIVSPLPLIQLRGRLDYLVHYPYGCVEQTTSTSFPMLYLADIAAEVEPEGFANRDIPGYVREGIRRLGTMQTSSGGFSMWPYGEDVNVWGTIYATHFLVEARRGGYLVESTVYDRALAYVAQLANARPAYDHEGLREAIYALYVLGRAGKPELGTMDFIRSRHAAELSSDMRAMLGAAYAGTGNQGAVQQLFADIETEEQIARFTGGSYASPMRNRALVLLALLDAAPSDPRIPSLVERQIRDAVADRYYTTQESALVLLAIGRYLRQQRGLGPYSGKVLVDGKPVGSFTSKTARFKKLPAGNVRVVLDEPYHSGAAFYALRTRGVPTVASFHPSSEGLRITRTFLTREGTVLPSLEAKQGDLLVVRIEVETIAGPMQNVVVENLLPAGLEVENPRLSTTETLPWVNVIAAPQHADARDDRVLFFVDLQPRATLTFYTLVRAVTPGVFALPPTQAEAMYNPAFHSTGELQKFSVAR